MIDYDQIAAVYQWSPDQMESLTRHKRQWWVAAAVRKAKRARG